MNTKVLIEVKGGIVQAISSNKEIDIVLVDWDELDSGKPAFNGDVLAPDALFEDGEAHQLFTDESDPAEMEVRDELKRIKF